MMHMLLRNTNVANRHLSPVARANSAAIAEIQERGKCCLNIDGDIRNKSSGKEIKHQYQAHVMEATVK